ncbi:hypothetical protein E2A64_04930 [Pseudohoeflea suaedae]|uniref:Uncharacterized protein n=1 Tax=Pseudohoeflea suaedae TaxID=877384 RepID=A0A4R5PNI5_9HYPH|nr:hypothetical protein [Pseudohoeflea suaedae]TDH38458.1 hypothetical protein E2A64_04930 [Pseudohoeflea suaedae]
MPYQNRVDPAGDLFSSESRGLFIGNRGVIHDPETKTLGGKRWSTTAWICCALSYRERKRDVWGKNGRNGGAGWTELFFLDEITALAAGHRPCNTCRRENATSFKAAWCEANKGKGAATDMNRTLHAERLHSRSRKPETVRPASLPDLPDGTIVLAGATYFALRDGRALPWGFSEYAPALNFSNLNIEPITVVTPKSVIGCLKAGYRPEWHPSADQAA